MEEFEKKPSYATMDEIDNAIGKILWGKRNKKFSMRKLIFAFIKKKIRGK